MTESAVDNLRVMLASACAFALLFSVADKLSYRYVRVYRDFSRAEQADWSSRCGCGASAVVGVCGDALTL